MSHRVGSALCYLIFTSKGKLIARTTVQHISKGKAATDDCQRINEHYHKFLAEDFGQGDHYASDLDGIGGFTHNDGHHPYETYKEAYNGLNAMMDVDDYLYNAEDVEAASYSYDTYISVELNFPDFYRNSVYRRVKKRVQNNYGQAVAIINHNPLLDMIKYKVDYLEGYIEEMTTYQIVENDLS